MSSTAAAQLHGTVQDLQSEEKGRQLFQNGLLSEALLAFEAEVQRNPQNVQAWRLLGTVHAENDDDRQVIPRLLGEGLPAQPSHHSGCHCKVGARGSSSGQRQQASCSQAP